MPSTLLQESSLAYYGGLDVECVPDTTTRRLMGHHLKHEVMQMAADINRSGTGDSGTT